MEILTGKSVFGGIEIGNIYFYKRIEQKIERRHLSDIQREEERFNNAKNDALKQLQDMYEKAVRDIGEENAMIFQMHQMMLEDIDYNQSILHMIREQHVNAEYAVSKTSDNFCEMFENMDDIYMQGRANDVMDISERVIQILMKIEEREFFSDTPVIVVADDLVPSETVQLDKSKVLGFATMYGSITSHTAILAKTMNIPALIGLGEALKEEMDGKLAIIDGVEGKLYVEPDERTLTKMRQKQEQIKEKRQLLQELKGKDTITRSGRRIELYANIGKLSDIGFVLQNDAGGIGLFRSEFLYLEKETFPTEEEQFLIYKKVAETMAGRKVIIRTLDVGADKQIDYFKLDKEENPALGYRAIRICLEKPDLFKTQLRALLRASAYGKIAIMFPMITAVWEIREIKRILHEAKGELKKTGVKYDEKMEIGIMIETPAAVMISRELAKEVDFFSVGTNDLTQYTLAVDRQNPQLDTFYDARHPAILKMIRMTVENAHAEGIWVGICGELGADLEITEELVQIGIDEISVAPSMVLPIRKKIRELE